MTMTAHQELGPDLAIADRRSQERYDYVAPVTILLPVRGEAEQPREHLRKVNGWTRNISEAGIRFECGEEFDDPRVLLACELPDFGAICVEVQIFNSRSIHKEDGATAWEYGAIYRRWLR